MCVPLHAAGIVGLRPYMKNRRLCRRVTFLSLPLSRTGELKGENALDVVGAACLRKHELEEYGGLLRRQAAGADAAGRK